ncbi:MAG: cell envelope integrity protein CreD [Bacteroidetes bacterium]|nr:cell envelope integrity protein CreD [Bacteroidota bacterium]
MLNLAFGITVYLFIFEQGFEVSVLLITTLCFIGSLPTLLILLILIPATEKFLHGYNWKITVLIFMIFIISIGYGFIGGWLFENPFTEYSSIQNFLESSGIYAASIFFAGLLSCIINLKNINKYFQLPSNKTQKMENNSMQPYDVSMQAAPANKLWVKGFITAGLILVMMIPTVFVYNLVEERQSRQEEVKDEVSSKWAGAQNITFPYLYVPYTVATTNADGKTTIATHSFIILPANLNVNGTVSTEERKRSIYSVLLYNSSLNASGSFNIEIPDGIDASTINWAGSTLCFGISDFKGIEQMVTTKFNNINYDLAAGLPSNKLDSIGLSAPVALTAENVGQQIAFAMPLKIKGTDQLHFYPMAGNSHFKITSGWHSPSFDGNTLPNERTLDNKGFEAVWNFNKANLPFNTLLKDFNFKKEDYSFGVSLLQPADQYVKTIRCVKYVILFIGLTFSLFFIVEIMQKKPFHPIQYVLVGLALVIFFTLLLSISEFLLFDVAYLFAALATVSLITLYAKSHFKSWPVAGVFAGTIGLIYGFIFILIRLEDTALLVGSIGLFIILATAMYASRKINWYGNTIVSTAGM